MNNLFLRNFLFIVSAVVVFTACDPNRVAERNIDLEESVWHPDSIKRFQFEIKNNEPYNLYLNLRNNRDYPFHNIYIAYTLQDSLGNEVINNTEEYILFEPKTGKPLGQGFGDIQTHQFPILENHTFKQTGNFKLVIQHYMRPEILEGMLSVGFRLENADNGS